MVKTKIVATIAFFIVILTILRILFQQDEVKIAIYLDFQLKKVKDLASEAGVSEVEAKEKLEAMANRGCVFHSLIRFMLEKGIRVEQDAVSYQSHTSS
jgi:hypothetical protein